MVLFNREGERWKPLQLPKGFLSVESPKKKAKTDTVLIYNICKGTLHGIYVALDPFNFLYEHHVGGGKLVTMELHVPSGLGIVFTSLLNHAGGANQCADEGDESKYVYCLFAYIVSDISHYPAETGTHITIPDAMSKEKNEKRNDTGVIGHTMMGRKIVATKKFTYD
jgi:hypothetical protein